MLRTAVALALLVVLMGVAGARETHAGGVYLVDSLIDNVGFNSGCNDGVVDPPPGDCSLRAAITLANVDPSIKFIFFGLGGGTPTVQVVSPLPAITAPVIMEGASGGADAINISGTGAPNSAGLYLSNHSGSTIRNMVINGFTGAAGLLIRGGGGHQIEGNLIGSNVQGTKNFHGIDMEDTTGNTIGGASMDRNYIYGNLSNGIGLDLGANNNTIVGNVIGLGVDESTIIGNTTGVGVLGSGNQIGTAMLPNIIAGNNNGVVIVGQNTRVEGNLIGVNQAGLAKPNELYGIFVDGSEGPTVIGGSLENGNVISGNAEAGVYLDLPMNVDVSGNIIGLNPDGDAAVPNSGPGIEIVNNYNFTAAGVTGGVEIGKPGAGNVISGNTGGGIAISEVGGVSVRENKIGVSADGTAGFGNGSYGIHAADANDTTIADNTIAAHTDAGIFIHSQLIRVEEGGDILNNFVGGMPDIAGNGTGILIVADSTNITHNTIVENTFEGINIAGDGNRVDENFIGTNSDGGEVGNGWHGVYIAGNGNVISPVVNLGAQPAGGVLFPPGVNIIWNNGGSGVFVAEGVGNTINQNWMKDNALGAIDLAPEGPTPNDTDDPDNGANDRQNFPVLTAAGQSAAFAQSVQPAGGGGFLQGSLNSTPNTEFEIDVYTQPVCNEIANLQPAEEWIGSFEVTTDANGDAEFSQAAFTDMEPGAFVNATATSPTGSTSELSGCIQVLITVPTPTPSPTPTSSPTATPGPTATPTPTPSPTDVFGDADCDGDVDMDDFVAALREVAGLPPGAPCEGNVGCEDPVDAQDALDILLYVASPADYPLPLC